MGGTATDEIRFIRKVLIALGIVAVALFAWGVRDALLLGFAAIIAGLVLDMVSQPFRARLGMRRSRALLAGGLLLVLLVAGAVLLIGAQVAAQVGQLAEALPPALRQLQERAGIGQEDLERYGGQLVAQVGAFLLAVADALSALVLATVAGVFLATDPDRYKRGLLKLAPPGVQARLGEALETSGKALKQWLLGTGLAMLLVGVAAGLGTWALGLPAPLALGLAAGLAEFVPVVGTFVGALPAVLLAISLGGETVLWTIGLYLLIQQLESNMITPLVQRDLVDIDAPLLLFGVVAIGILFGLPGLILAAPLTVVAAVFVQLLYIRGALGQPTEVPGEEDGPDQARQP